MHIAYKSLLIRNATQHDAPLLCRWWNDGAVMAHAGFPNGLGTTEQKIVAQLATDSDEKGRRLILMADDQPIGEMSYRNMGDRTAEIGIKICDFTQQGKGYGSIFLRMLLTHLFANGYDRIVLDTNLANQRAQHVYEKLGFERLGVRHNAWTDQLGAAQSCVDYALNSKDFVPLDL